MAREPNCESIEVEPELSVCQRRFTNERTNERMFYKNKRFSTFLYAQNSKAFNVNILHHQFKMEQNIGHSTNSIHKHTHTHIHAHTRRLVWNCVEFIWLNSSFSFYLSIHYPMFCIERRQFAWICNERKSKFTAIFFSFGQQLNGIYFSLYQYISPEKWWKFHTLQIEWMSSCNLWLCRKVLREIEKNAAKIELT